jgi:hypothetical protein
MLELLEINIFYFLVPCIYLLLMKWAHISIFIVRVGEITFVVCVAFYVFITPPQEFYIPLRRYKNVFEIKRDVIVVLTFGVTSVQYFIIFLPSCFLFWNSNWMTLLPMAHISMFYVKLGLVRLG